MQVFNKAQEVSFFSDYAKKNHQIVGFVPTMGALHDGHISLVKKAKKESDVVIASIFVNPTQFNDKNDLKKYPKDLDGDLAKLREAGCDAVFVPDEKEIYPKKIDKFYNFGNLDKVMEGKHRPGHFKGVAMVVERLFNIVNPQKAFFGEKDFQQLAIIKALVKMLGLNVEIVPCPIIREPSGLAMSSRNQLLNGIQKKVASAISGALFKAVDIAKSRNLKEVKDFVRQEIIRHDKLKLEYFEIVDADSLVELKKWGDSDKPVGCIAVKIGNVRLIDNIRFYS
jgi:pantoate--beta-alanine ligase